MISSRLLEVSRIRGDVLTGVLFPMWERVILYQVAVVVHFNEYTI